MRYARVPPLPPPLPPSPAPMLLARLPAPAQPTKSISSERRPIAFAWWCKAASVAERARHSQAACRRRAGPLHAPRYSCRLRGAGLQAQPVEPSLPARGAVAGQCRSASHAALCVERFLVAQLLKVALVVAVPVVERGREIGTCSQAAPARRVRAVRLGWGSGRPGAPVSRLWGQEPWPILVVLMYGWVIVLATSCSKSSRYDDCVREYG